VTATDSTVPAAGDSTGISIFIDSMMTRGCPSSTASPGFTSIFQTVPVMWACTLVGMWGDPTTPLADRDHFRDRFGGMDRPVTRIGAALLGICAVVAACGGPAKAGDQGAACF